MSTAASLYGWLARVDDLAARFEGLMKWLNSTTAPRSARGGFSSGLTSGTLPYQQLPLEGHEHRTLDITRSTSSAVNFSSTLSATASKTAWSTENRSTSHIQAWAEGFFHSDVDGKVGQNAI